MCWIILTLRTLFLILSVTKLYPLIPLLHLCFPVWYREILFLLSALCFARANVGYGVIQWVVQVEVAKASCSAAPCAWIRMKEKFLRGCFVLWWIGHSLWSSLASAAFRVDSCSVLVAQEILYMVSWLDLINHAFVSLVVSAALQEISCCQRLTALLQLFQVQ